MEMEAESTMGELFEALQENEVRVCLWFFLFGGHPQTGDGSIASPFVVSLVSVSLESVLCNNARNAVRRSRNGSSRATVAG